MDALEIEHPFFGRCDYCCSTSKKTLSKCGSCLLVAYCGKECQRAAWKLHKTHCESTTLESVRVLLSKAEGGCPESMYRLGLCYLHGAKVERSDAEAVRWFTMAGSYPPAQLNLGLLLIIGRGAPRDAAGGTALIRAAAEAGDSMAQLQLSISLMRGLAGRHDPQESVRWAHLAAEGGIAEAFHCLGVAYAMGSGVARNVRTALRWFLRAADAGRHDSLLPVAAVLEGGGDGLAPDPVAALEWKRRAAAVGVPEGMASLADALIKGLGTAIDAEGAARLYKAAAEAGVPRAAVSLGGLLESGGCGAPADAREAVGWFRVAAEAGSEAGQFNLGRCLLHGIGCARDPAEAARWFELAAQVRVSPQSYLGVKRPVTPANIAAQYHLAVCYARGDGVPFDLDRARRFAGMAASAGHEGARSLLASMEGAARGATRVAEQS